MQMNFIKSPKTKPDPPMSVLGAPVVGMKLCILCEIRPSMKPSFASHTYHKTGSGQKSRNKAARVGTLALFQDQVTLMVRLQLALCPDPLTCEDCNVAYQS